MSATAVGEMVPDFTLPCDGGGTMSSAELRGQTWVLFAYPKDDTSGCTAEAIDFTAARADFDAIGVQLIGVSPDAVKKHDKFKAKHQLTVPLLADEEKALLQALGVWKEKSMYGRKYMGVERTTYLIGPEGRIAHIWPKVSVPGHVAEVLQAARDLVAKASV